MFKCVNVKGHRTEKQSCGSDVKDTAVAAVARASVSPAAVVLDSGSRGRTVAVGAVGAVFSLH